MSDTQQKVFIKLTQVGTRPDTIIAILSKIQGLRETPEALVSHTPCYISGKVPLVLAEKVKEYLERAGATVELEANEQAAAQNKPTVGTSFDSLKQHLTTIDESENTALYEGTEASPPEEDITYFDVEPPASEMQLSDMFQQSMADVAAGNEPEHEEQDEDENEAEQAPAPKPRKKVAATPPIMDIPVEEPAIDTSKPPRQPQKSSNGRSLLIPGLVIGILVMLVGGFWWYRSTTLSSGARSAGQPSLLSTLGTIVIENPEEADVMLQHVIATRVMEPVALNGLTANLPRGDYYVQARKGAQLLQYPVYIKGRGHRVMVSVEFPREPTPETMAYIPAGWFRMGNKETDASQFGFPDERPDIDVFISAFLMSKYEVTNQEYAEFLAAKGYEKEVYWESLLNDWKSLVAQVPEYGTIYGTDGWNAVRKYLQTRFIDTDGRPGPRLWEEDVPPYEDGQDKYPVTGISFYEADAYCMWLTQKMGKVYRLPTEAEWEKAARSYEGYFFSYGNEYDATRANTESQGPKNVGSYAPNGFGVYDLTGNLWEWVSDHYREDAYKYLRDTYKTDIRNPRIFNEAEPYGRRIVRGGSFRSVNRVNAKATIRYPMYPNDWHTNIGFRYVTTP